MPLCSTTSHTKTMRLCTHRNRNTVIIILILTVCIVRIFYFYFHNTTHNVNELLRDNSSNYFSEKYLVNTPNCRIANIDPFNEEIKDFVRQMEPIQCSDKPLLSYVKIKNNVATLNINRSAMHLYSSFEISCCYSLVLRGSDKNLDDKIDFSDCIPFHDHVSIKENTIKVSCHNYFQNVYSNVHSVILPPKNEPNYDRQKFPSILLIGIDGVSKLNLIRSMPKTYQYLEENKWLNLKGYHKIEDNTFPNLMALLTGMNYTDASTICNPQRYKLDTCNFVWKRFKQYGYTTAYAEDIPWLNTFNYLKKGFIKPPTDYYFRPYFLATDQLPSKKYCGQSYCTGPENTGQRMLNIIQNFLRAYVNFRSFGLFWMNSFSHDNINCPSTMDSEVLQFLKTNFKNHLLDNTIILFFSDHGFRYGDIRSTHTGWMEERLPFIYFRFPENFKKRHKVEYNNLIKNLNIVTSTYDVYMTLQHILFLLNKDYKISPSRGCPKCRSLLTHIDPSRNCTEAGILPHWCTCRGYYFLDRESKLIKSAAIFLLQSVNNLIASYKDVADYCAKYLLNKIVNAESLTNDTESGQILLTIRTFPTATFEATLDVVYNRSNKEFVFQILSSISRIDRYGPRSYCVKNSPVQKYCFCNSYYMMITNVFCNNYFCIF